MKTTLNHVITAMACAFAIPVCAWASPDHMLVHVNGSDTPHSIEISADTRITFDNTTMHVAHPAGNLSLEIADIDRMVFDLETSSTEEVEAALDADITITAAAGHVTAVSASGAQVSLVVYDATGRHVSSATGEGMADADMSGCRPGVYILVCGNKTIKYLNR